MEKKKSSRLTEIVFAVILIICLSLIVLELSDNVSNKIEEIERSQ